MKRFIFIITCFYSLLYSVNSDAKELKFGKDLTVQIPDSMRYQSEKDFFEGHVPGELALYVKWLSTKDRDILKMESIGDTIVFPVLASAKLINTDHESWNDWSHDWRRNTYQMDNDDTVYCYQITANGHRYYFFFYPLNEVGKELADGMMTNGFDNDKWFGNAGAWWVVLIILMMLFSSLYYNKSSSEGGFSRYLCCQLFFTLPAIALAAYFCQGEWNQWWKISLLLVGIGLIAPPWGGTILAKVGEAVE